MQLPKRPKELSKAQICDVFKNHSLEITEPLLNFELIYSGLIIPVGLCQIKFSIIWGGGSPFNSDLATIEFEKNERKDANYLISCSKSDMPVEYQIDEKGRIYEDHILSYNSFEELLSTVLPT